MDHDKNQKVRAEAQEKSKREQERFYAGRKRNENLVKLAKDSGIKGVRIGMRTATLEEKLRKAGIDF